MAIRAPDGANKDHISSVAKSLSINSTNMFNSQNIYGVFRFLGPAENVCDQPESRVRLPNSNVQHPGSIP